MDAEKLKIKRESRCPSTQMILISIDGKFNILFTLTLFYILLLSISGQRFCQAFVQGEDLATNYFISY